ncbi:DsbC/DsbD-like thiol-disulfide interchange protein [Rhizobium aquaticum]|uniref:DsbC/DsbD-like thiol-disulfide interchange protein n=1 Tax=Rhizobium aquaticum TaxID=1549636 RepID=A0ABV2J2W6_9HYPH
MLTKRFMMAALLALPSLCTMTLPVWSASSPWIGTKGGKLRLVALPPDGEGTIRGFVEITPEDGWHTYWKVPGSGGIPPQISLKEGGNARLEKVDFPAPRIFDDGNLRDFGYDARVMLPVTLKQDRPGQPSTIAASVFIGLCADICVPFQAEVSAKVAPDDKPKPAELALVNAANALLPEAPGTDFSVAEASATADGQGVVMKLRLPAGADVTTADIIAIGPDGQPLSRLMRRTSEAGTLFAEARLQGGSATSLAGKSLTILALAGSRAMETTVVLK